MADKKTELAIVISTVDKATAKIKAINEELDKASKPRRDLFKALGELGEKSRINAIAEGFKGVGEAAKESLFKVVEMAAVLGEATHLVLELVEHFDDLGHKAERLGVGVDFLAGMRDAAERTGVPMEMLDQNLQTFSQNLGQATTHTGRMYKFLTLVNPKFRDQVIHAKNAAEAFDFVAEAMEKETDATKRAALAQKIFGDSSLAPLLAKGSKSIKEMREHYIALAGTQGEAVEKSMEVGESLHDLHATTDGLKAALVEGLAPALKVIIDRLAAWFHDHRADVREWAESIGEKLPAAVQAVVEWLSSAYDKVSSFVSAIGGLKAAAAAVAAVIAGPLLASMVSLGLAIATSPFGPWLVGLAAIVVAEQAAEAAIRSLVAYGRRVGERAAFRKLVSQHADEIRDNNPELSDAEVQSQARNAARYDIAQSHAVEDADEKQQEYNDAHANDQPGIPASESAMFAPNASDLAREAFIGNNDALASSFMKAMQDGPVVKTMLTVGFENAPKGMRVTEDPQSKGRVDFSTGYQMGFGT